MRLGSQVAVAVVYAGGYGSDSTPSHGYAAGVALKGKRRSSSSSSSSSSWHFKEGSSVFLTINLSSGVCVCVCVVPIAWQVSSCHRGKRFGAKRPAPPTPHPCEACGHCLGGLLGSDLCGFSPVSGQPLHLCQVFDCQPLNETNRCYVCPEDMWTLELKVSCGFLPKQQP